MKKSPNLHSDIIQEYTNNYRKALNIALHNIERKNPEAAKIFYILALLDIDFEQKALRELFGDTVDEKIIILSKCRVIKTDSEERFHTVNIHNVIKEEAIKRLDKKAGSCRKKIIQSLVAYCKKFYAKKDHQYFHGLNPDHNHLAALYAFIDIALQNDIIDEKVIDAVNIALRLNEMLFNEYASQVLHRQIASEVYNKNLDNISPLKRAQLYTNFRFADFIFKSKNSILKFEKEYLRLLSIIENDKNCTDISFFYVYLSSVYIVLGDFRAAKEYIEKAEKNINCTNDIFNLPSVSLCLL